MIMDIVEQFVSKETVVFVTTNAEDDEIPSSDVDIYCVTSCGQSSVHMFYNDDRLWTELFIDTVADLRNKLAHVDEIAVNFIRELRFASGDRETYEQLLAEVSQLVKEYRLPPSRKNLLKYRVKTILSKYSNLGENSSLAQKYFLLNSMSYPLIQLVLEHHRIFPSSPKRWIGQLRDSIPRDDFEEIDKFLAHRCTNDDAIRLCAKYAGDLDAVHMEKKAGENNSTFLS